MAETRDEYKVVCPWCAKGEVYTEGTGKAAVTVRCPKCMHFFRVRLDDYSTEKVQAHRRVQNRIYRLSGTYRTVSEYRR